MIKHQLKKYLLEQDKSFVIMSEEVGLTKGYLSQLDNGKVSPSRHTAKLIKAYTKDVVDWTHTAPYDIIAPDDAA
jgi:transcriptional regulator with XRE-family HTH domain